jgi:hypothetical protein
MSLRRGWTLLLIAFVLNWNMVLRSHAQNLNGHRQFPPGVARTLKDLPESKLRTRIERLPKGAQDRAMAWLSNFHFTDLDLTTLQADAAGGIFYADEFQLAPVPADSANEPLVAAAAVPVTPFPANLLFHSKLGAPNVIFLNFSGETVQSTAWNTSLSRSVIPALPYSSDADRTTFSDSEQLSIRRIWQRVSEDYSAFNVDVTTERPATFTTKTAMAVITRNTDSNGQPNPSSTAGGVSYVGVFGNSTFASYRPAWIYDNNLAGEESYIAEATSHEIGHNMGLSHDGATDGRDYYLGHGTGDTSWAPIMGAGYGRNVTQWSKGDYYLANNAQDDLATMAGKLSYRTDDHGNTLSSASPLVIDGGGVIASTTPETDPANASPANKGILERNTDVDWFSFASGSGPVSLRINPWITPGALAKGGDIDIEVDLYDETGKLLLTNNSVSLTYATIQTNLSEGVYYLSIRNVGTGDPFSSTPTGYSSYGGIGQYFISGTVVPSGIVTPPGATLVASDLTSPGIAKYQFAVTYTDNLAIDASTIDSNDVIVTGPNGYSQAASLVSVDLLTDGTPRMATYSISASGATWMQADNGIYTVTTRANAVGDTEGAWVPARDLGQFTVAIPNVIYAASMDTNPGWTFQGLWQYGAPNYATTAAPTSGYTGANIVAYNLSGNYENRLSAAYAATPTIDCSGYTQLTLKFRRWLRLRSGDSAMIQVSTNGTTWSTVWSTTKTVSDSSWQDVQYSLPAFAGASGTVQLRWGIASGTSGNDIGWNIDDVLVLGNGAVDTVPPVATINVPNIVNGGSPVHSFTVTYTDDVAVSVASLGVGDLYVLGPNGFSNVVDFAGVDITTDGSPRTATYTLSAPDGLWSSTNNGTYQVFLSAGEVSDTANNSFDEILLGTFTVAISGSHQAILVDPVSLTIPEGGQSTFSVQLAEQPSANVTVTITRMSGDTNVIIVDATPIVFTPANWNVPVPVAVQALTDADRADAVATFEIRSDGLASESILVTQTDTTPDPNAVPLTIDGITDTAGSLGMSIDAVVGISYTLQTTTDFVTWTDVETKVAASATVTFKTPETGEPARYYRIKR